MPHTDATTPTAKCKGKCKARQPACVRKLIAKSIINVPVKLQNANTKNSY